MSDRPYEAPGESVMAGPGSPQPAETVCGPAVVSPPRPKIGEYRRHLLVCTGPRCSVGGGYDGSALFEDLADVLAEAGLTRGELRVKRTRVQCFAACKGGPILCVQPDGVWYCQVTPEVLRRIVREHLKDGRPVREFQFHQGPGGASDASD